MMYFLEGKDRPWKYTHLIGVSLSIRNGYMVNWIGKFKLDILIIYLNFYLDFLIYYVID